MFTVHELYISENCGLYKEGVSPNLYIGLLLAPPLIYIVSIGALYILGYLDPIMNSIRDSVRLTTLIGILGGFVFLFEIILFSSVKSYLFYVDKNDGSITIYSSIFYQKFKLHIVKNITVRAIKGSIYILYQNEGGIEIPVYGNKNRENPNTKRKIQAIMYIFRQLFHMDKNESISNEDNLSELVLMENYEIKVNRYCKKAFKFPIISKKVDFAFLDRTYNYILASYIFLPSFGLLSIPFIFETELRFVDKAMFFSFGTLIMFLGFSMITGFDGFSLLTYFLGFIFSVYIIPLFSNRIISEVTESYMISISFYAMIILYQTIMSMNITQRQTRNILRDHLKIYFSNEDLSSVNFSEKIKVSINPHITLLKVAYRFLLFDAIAFLLTFPLYLVIDSFITDYGFTSFVAKILLGHQPRVSPAINAFITFIMLLPMMIILLLSILSVNDISAGESRYHLLTRFEKFLVRNITVDLQNDHLVLPHDEDDVIQLIWAFLGYQIVMTVIVLVIIKHISEGFRYLIDLFAVAPLWLAILLTIIPALIIVALYTPSKAHYIFFLNNEVLIIGENWALKIPNNLVKEFRLVKAISMKSSLVGVMLFYALRIVVGEESYYIWSNVRELPDNIVSIITKHFSLRGIIRLHYRDDIEEYWADISKIIKK